MFDIEPIEHEYPLLESEERSFRLVPRPGILEWAEKELDLISPGYVYPGPFRARPWQRELIDASLYWDKVYYVGATQVGKTMCVDVPMFYYMAAVGINGMVAYANKETVETVFKLRIHDMIENNACLKENWSGNEDDLTILNIKLKNCLWRIASAQNKNDLASFSAAISIGSEVAKWERMKQFHPVGLLGGRQGAYEQSGEHKLFLESSPFEVGDYLFKEVFKSGTIILRPHYQCPHCRNWQTWIDSQIKLRKVGGIEPDHNPERIREEGESAVYYECVHCKQEITEDERKAAAERVVWAAPEIERDSFKQKAEKIFDNGEIEGRLDGGKRKNKDAVAYNFNRLVDVSFPFYKMLALFFETKSDPQAHKTYINETVAWWPEKESRKVEIEYLESKKVEGYFQYGDKHRIPDHIVVLTCGVDTQDNGFYYTVVGWGHGMRCLIVRHDFIELPIDSNQDHNQIYLKFREALYRTPLKWFDGSDADFRFGFIDRGGHRAEDVDCITAHMPNLKAYIGLTKVDDKKPVIYKAQKDKWFLGQSELLSDFTGSLMRSDGFGIPVDVSYDFLDQLWRQFFIKKIMPNGTTEEKWVHGFQGGDHYRDCFNLAWAAAKHLKLDTLLFNEGTCDIIKAKKSKPMEEVEAEVKRTQPTPQQQPRSDPMAMRRGGGYFQRAYGRGRR